MTRRRSAAPGPRHTPDWYDQSAEREVLAEGDRLFIACEGGPSASLTVCHLFRGLRVE